VERLADICGGDAASSLTGAPTIPADNSRHRLSLDALSITNYRRYFIGQIVSASGTWVQQTALSWLVLRLGGSGTDVGLVVALQFLPLLLLGPFGGLIVDRFPRRRLLLITAASSTVLAVFLFVVTSAGRQTLLSLYAFSLLSGLVTVVDNPARQAFASELVGIDHLASAIGLNGVLMNTARVVGPALAGLLIVVSSVPVCIAVNAISYVAVIVALLSIRSRELYLTPPAPREPRAVRQGLDYVRNHPDVGVPLAIMAVVGMISLNFPTVLPLLARDTFHGNAGTFGGLSAAMSVGAVAGALAAGTIRRPTSREVAQASVAFGILMVAAALAPNLAIEYVVIVPVGFTTYAFVTLAMTTVQMGADPALRGRVMALWAIAFAGTTPIGGPSVGAIAQAFGPRAALGVGAVGAIMTGLVALAILRRSALGHLTRQG
jgi:MFS family permease